MGLGHASAAIDIAALAAFVLVALAARAGLRSARRQAREANQGFRAAFDQSPLAQIILAMDPADPGSMILERANAAFDRLSGSEPTARSPSAILGEDPSSMAYIAHACASGLALDGMEIGFVDPGGVRKSLLLSATPLTWSARPALLCALADRTEALGHERGLREINAALESRSIHRAAELTAARRELQNQERLASLGSMVAGIAHELNTPIGNARLTASTLLESTADAREALATGGLRKSELERHFDHAQAACELLLRSLERSGDLIAQFKQVSADRSSCARRSFDLRALAIDTLAVHGPAMKARAIPIRACALGDALSIDSYPGPLGQVISNLINNSLLHAFEGRESGEIEISLWTESHGSTACLRYRDDGVGIERGSLGRVFDPFYTTKLGQGGAGLGMYITHNIVCDLLGGSIKIESPPGHGAVITLKLPTQAPRDDDAPDTGPQSRSLGAGS